VKCDHISVFPRNVNPTDFDDGHGAPKKLTGEKSMGMSFFALPSKQGPVQGRFKQTHLPISLSTKVAACVRRCETPTPLNDGRPALALSFRRCVWIEGHFTCLLSLLIPYEPGLGQGQRQKRYLHAHQSVSFMYKPKAKLRGHVLKGDEIYSIDQKRG
jgi:hypothetical protein